MKLTINWFDNHIDFRNTINILEIHDVKLYSKTIFKINNSIKHNEDSQDILLVDDNGIEQLSKHMLIIIDLFNIDINSKNILNKLYSKIEQISRLDNDINQDLSKLISKIVMYIKDKLYELPFEYEINNNITIKDLLKVTSIKIDTSKYETLLEQVFFYIDVITEFKLCNILIFVNIKSYFSEKDLNLIYEYCLNKKISILIIENNKNKLLKYEKKLTITSDFDDFCE